MFLEQRTPNGRAWASDLVLAGIFFRNEQFAPIQLLGVAIILAGVWGVNQGKKKAPANL